MLSVHYAAVPQAQNTVPFLQPGLGRGTTGNQFTDEWLRQGTGDSDTPEQGGVNIAHPHLRHAQHDLPGRGLVWRTECETDVLALQGTLGQAPAQIVEGVHWHYGFAVHCGRADQLTTHNPCLIGDGCWHGAGQDGPWLLHSAPVNQRIQQHRQQQIDQWSGSHDGRPRCQRLVVESQMPQLWRNRRFTFIEHSHVATDRKHTNHKFSSRAFWLPAPDSFAKPHGKPQHPHAAGHGNPVVAELMHRDQHAQRNHKCNNGQQD